jgi:hypothetical protein
VKISTGFISNSSTTSFALLGYKMTRARAHELIDALALDPEEETWDITDRLDLGYVSEISYSSRDEVLEVLLGKFLLKINSDDSCTEEAEFDIVALTAEVEELGRQWGMEDKPHMFTGTYSS